MRRGLAGTCLCRQVTKVEISQEVGLLSMKERDALVFGTLGIELMISARNLRTRGESTMISTLPEPAQGNYLKPDHEEAWQDRSFSSACR